MAGYSVTFSVVDDATKQIEAINKRIAAMRAPMERMSKQISRFVDVSGLRRVADGFGWIGRAATSVLRSLIEIVPLVGTLTGAATLAGLTKLVSIYADWNRQLQATADSIGETTQHVQQFEDAMRLAGGNAGDMDQALSGLYKTVTDFSRGTASADTIGWLNRLGINVHDANGNLRSMSSLMPEVIKKLEGIKNPADRAAAATALLGSAGDKVVEGFRQSSRSFSDWLTLAGQYNAVSDAQKKDLEAFSEAQGKVGVAFDHLGQQVSAVLAKNLTPLFDHLADFVTKNQPQIIAAVDQLSTKFAAWVEGINWKSVEDGLTSVINSLMWVTNHLDEIKTAAEVIAGIFIVKWGVTAIASIVKLVTAIGTITSAIGTAGAGAAGGATLLGALSAVAALASTLLLKGDTATETPEMKAAREKRNAEEWEEYQRRNPEAARQIALEHPEMIPAGAYPPSWPPTNPIGTEMRYRGGPGGPLTRPITGPPTAAAGSLTLSQKGLDRAIDIRDRLMRDLGLSRGGAAGLVGNLQAETAGITGEQEKNPLGGGRGGIGWAQWTGPRRLEFEAYQKAHPEMSWDEQNYNFLTGELQKPENAAVLTSLRRGDIAPGEAADVVEKGYERPAPGSSTRRETYAAQFYREPVRPAAAAAASPIDLSAAAPGLGDITAPPRINGKVDVNITGKNLPPDTAVTAKGTGAVNVPPPKVEFQNFDSP